MAASLKMIEILLRLLLRFMSPGDVISFCIAARMEGAREGCMNASVRETLEKLEQAASLHRYMKEGKL